MQIQISDDPFLVRDPSLPFGYRPWPARWIGLEGVKEGAPIVVAYRCFFKMAAAETIRIHVSADERFELFLDGHRVGRGPERGCPEHWFYHTYELALEEGPHVLVARVWSLGSRDALAPVAQMRVQHGLLVAAEGSLSDQLSTGVGHWEGKRLGGYRFTPPSAFGVGAPFIGAGETIDAASFPWGFHRGEGEGWSEAEPLEWGQSRGAAWGEAGTVHLLRPAVLAPMMEVSCAPGKVRAVEPMDAGVDPSTHPIQEGGVDERWQGILEGRAVLVAPNTRFRVIIDLEDYYCGYPELTLSQGSGAEVRVEWAESLFEKPNDPRGEKGHRDTIDGKFAKGIYDIFQMDGSAGRTFIPLWWRCGRYIALMVETADESLSIDRFGLRETRYPLEVETAFRSDDAQLARTLPLLVRGLQMCSHETYMDCPYYEQMMYVGDTRLEVLTTLVLTQDDRLPRKAVETFDWSRRPDGLTQSRFPSQSCQVIPPFSLWWVCMTHDLAMWRGDKTFIAARMPGVRSVLETFRSYLRDGLIEAPDGWNFVDWEPRWREENMGAPPGGAEGISAPINWQMVLALLAKAELEQWMEEPALAQRDQELAEQIARKLIERFWCEERGLFADNVEQNRFSEHSQCLALLSDCLPEKIRSIVVENLFLDKELSRTTIYYSHYLFEACAKAGRMDVLFARLSEWYALGENGLRTPIEHPEPTRSDCHAWGSHPLYHTRASILGIRPIAPGFERVEVRPQPGPLSEAAGTVPHPRGDVRVEVKKAPDGVLSGVVVLPPGTEGVLRVNGESFALPPGATAF